MKVNNVVSVAAVAGAASASTLQGFNFGSTDTSGAPFSQQQFEQFFQQAQNLQGTSGFNSARLYTMIQAGTQNTPIAAIPAALAQKDTSLLLGLWASGGDGQFANEIAALKNTINQYGSQLAGKVVGISVGSEDLYRDSIMGVQAKAGIGAGPDVVVNYIKQVRSVLENTPLANVPLGHVDTWTAWVNGSNAEVIQNVDWLGFDAYPYFQNTMPNSLSDAKGLFYQALDNTKGVSQGKDVWITETGWPVSGPQSNEAVASVENAQFYWQEIGCELFGQENIYWYTLNDAIPTAPSPSFSIINADGSPKFDLTCNASSKDNTQSSSSSSSSASSAAGSSAAAASSSDVVAIHSSATANGSSGAAATATKGAVAPSSSDSTSSGSSDSGSSDSGSSESGSSNSNGGNGSSQPASTSAAAQVSSGASANSTTAVAPSNGAGSLAVSGALAIALGAAAMLL